MAQRAQHIRGDPVVPNGRKMQAIGRPILALLQRRVAPVITEANAQLGSERTGGRRELISLRAHLGTARYANGRVSTRKQQRLGAGLENALQRALGFADDPRHVGAGAQHVVTATIETDERGPQIERRFELLGDNRSQQFAANRKVRILNRLAQRIGDTLRREISPPPHCAARHVVTDALGKAVTDRDIADRRALNAGAGRCLLARPGSCLRARTCLLTRSCLLARTRSPLFAARHLTSLRPVVSVQLKTRHEPIGATGPAGLTARMRCMTSSRSQASSVGVTIAGIALIVAPLIALGLKFFSFGWMMVMLMFGPVFVLLAGYIFQIVIAAQGYLMPRSPVRVTSVRRRAVTAAWLTSAGIMLLGIFMPDGGDSGYGSTLQVWLGAYSYGDGVDAMHAATDGLNDILALVAALLWLGGYVWMIVEWAIGIAQRRRLRASGVAV